MGVLVNALYRMLVIFVLTSTLYWNTVKMGRPAE